MVVEGRELAVALDAVRAPSQPLGLTCTSPCCCEYDTPDSQTASCDIKLMLHFCLHVPLLFSA